MPDFRLGKAPVMQAADGDGCLQRWAVLIVDFSAHSQVETASDAGVYGL